MGWHIETVSYANCHPGLQATSLAVALTLSTCVDDTQTGEEQINNSVSQQAIWVYGCYIL